MLIFVSKRGMRRLLAGALPGLVILAAATWLWYRWTGWVPVPAPWVTGRLDLNVGQDFGRDWDAATVVGGTPLGREEQRRLQVDLTGDGLDETVFVEAVYTNRYAGRRLGYYRVRVENGVEPTGDESAGDGLIGDRSADDLSDGRGAAAKGTTYVLESPLFAATEGERGRRGEGGEGDDGGGDVPKEMLAGAYGAPFTVKAVDMTDDGVRDLLIVGKAGQKNTPFYIFSWDGHAYVPILSELFWGTPRLVDIDDDGKLEVEGHRRVVSESTLLKRYDWRGGRWVPLSGDAGLAGTGGELVRAVLEGVSQAFLGIPLPNPTRWFAQEWIEDPSGWTAWRKASESWVSVQIHDVAFLTPETNERAGTWKVLGSVYEVVESGAQTERVPVLLTFETVREAGEWRIREIRREDPQNGL